MKSEELGLRKHASRFFRHLRPSALIALLVAAAVGATVAVACDETGPSSIGEHFDDAGPDTADVSVPDEASDEGGDGGDEGGDTDGPTDDGGDGGDGGDADKDAP